MYPIKSQILVTLLILIAFLGIGLPTAAQEAEAELPACQETQLELMAHTKNDFETLWTELKAVDTPEDLGNAFLSANSLHTRWWSEDVVAVPQCSPAVEASLVYGRLIDETLHGITMMLLAQLAPAEDDGAEPNPGDVTITQDSYFNRGWDHMQVAVELHNELRVILPTDTTRPGPDAYYTCRDEGGTIAECWYLIFQ